MVGNQFNQYIADKTIDRIIFLTHDDCASCKSFYPAFLQLAKVASERAKIIKFGALDCKDNDPPGNIEVHAYPRLVYYKDGSKDPCVESFALPRYCVKQRVWGCRRVGVVCERVHQSIGPRAFLWP